MEPDDNTLYSIVWRRDEGEKCKTKWPLAGVGIHNCVSSSPRTADIQPHRPSRLTITCRHQLNEKIPPTHRRTHTKTHTCDARRTQDLYWARNANSALVHQSDSWSQIVLSSTCSLGSGVTFLCPAQYGRDKGTDNPTCRVILSSTRRLVIVEGVIEVIGC